MAAVIASAESDRDQLNDILHRLDDEARDAVTVVGGPVAQALDMFLADAEETGLRARERAARTVEAARRVLSEYENADDQMAQDHHATSGHQGFRAARFSARIPR